MDHHSILYWRVDLLVLTYVLVWLAGWKELHTDGSLQFLVSPLRSETALFSVHMEKLKVRNALFRTQ
jgi:hypothetical protein